jgi:hypothetical protein
MEDGINWIGQRNNIFAVEELTDGQRGTVMAL